MQESMRRERNGPAAALRTGIATLRATLRGRPGLRQRGFMLVEAAVAVGIVGTATLTTLGFISTAAGAMAHTSAETTAAWVAASQVEYVSQTPFVATSGQYAAVPAPGGFVVSNTTAPYPGGDDAIQTVTITVSYQGSQVFSTEIVKVDR